MLLPRLLAALPVEDFLFTQVGLKLQQAAASKTFAHGDKIYQSIAMSQLLRSTPKVASHGSGRCAQSAQNPVIVESHD
jgi:hypothetical protein